jgi:hypothetical protein
MLNERRQSGGGKLLAPAAVRGVSRPGGCLVLDGGGWGREGRVGSVGSME